MVICLPQLADDFSAIKPETLQECITAKESWENTTLASWPVAKGLTVLKHKGVYCLFYTANDFRNPDYAVGYAISSIPLGPWIGTAGCPVQLPVASNKNPMYFASEPVVFAFVAE